MKHLFLLGATALAVSMASAAFANDRYAERPPVVVSPDLSAPWVMQLGQQPGKVVRRQVRQVRQQIPAGVQVQPYAVEPRFDQRYAPAQRRQQPQPDAQRTAGIVAPAPAKREVRRQIDPMYLPQQVSYDGPHKPGTIIIDTKQNFLFLVQANGEARRYGVGTGKPGFEWAGTHKVTAKREWPDWRPPAEMIVRERAKGRVLPVHMAGGPENPLGARAMYLGSTLYRIHGTNQPWTIGGAVSSGCIRMRNEDVVDLYDRVKIGTQVVVM
ncbi:L,D-transpeptidase [Mesorhizobium sp. DCY119]|jgi:lipoprotein-anchoring transpeptidase ErfK/SrfK|uniref:L,D-transpeptidase n=1 Tax=Mesorhizobium sp. DCY119 TaxID=2108445 RepID=UPI000E6B5A6E|nr:L,D-transpeptidase [Mesorhizobium sp. DCY119]RJG46324.1 L,D-transpeptidase [Mesorhizobium sp. DCY119]